MYIINLLNLSIKFQLYFVRHVGYVNYIRSCSYNSISAIKFKPLFFVVTLQEEKLELR